MTLDSELRQVAKTIGETVGDKIQSQIQPYVNKWVEKRTKYNEDLDKKINNSIQGSDEYNAAMSKRFDTNQGPQLLDEFPYLLRNYIKLNKKVVKNSFIYSFRLLYFKK